MAGVYCSSAALQCKLSHTECSLQVNDLSSRWKNTRSSFVAPPWNTKTRQAEEGGAHSPFWKLVHCKDKQNQIKGSTSQSSPRNRRACVLFKVKTKLPERKHMLRPQEHCSLRRSTENRASDPQGQRAGGCTGHTSLFHLERISERPPRKRLPPATHFLQASTCLLALSSPVHAFAHSLIHSDAQ